MRAEFASLFLDRRDGIATITFNRPRRLNALDYPSKWDLRAALALVTHDDAIKVIAFRGAGRAFCAGIDLSELSSGNIGEPNFRLWEECLRAIETCDKIAICLIHGYALGSGVQLALACDLRVATRTAKLGIPAGKEGLLPGLSVWRLARFVGMGRAKELAIWGDMIEAPEAARIGLLNRVVEDEAMETEFDALLAKTRDAATQGVRMTKQAMNVMPTLDYDAALDLYLGFQRRGLASADFAAAMNAWRERAKQT